MSRFLPHVKLAKPERSIVNIREDGPSRPAGSFELYRMPAGPGTAHVKPGRGDSIVNSDVQHKTRIVPAAVRVREGSSPPPSPPVSSSSAVHGEPEEVELSDSEPAPQDVVQTFSSPYMNRWRYLGCCLALLGNGMNDSAPGALLPYIESYYGVNYSTVSVIFVANALGFITSAFLTQLVESRLGRARTLALSDAVIIVSYIMMAVTPPFPVYAIAYFVTGIAVAVQLALNCVFVANLANSAVLMGVFQASYGIGGIIGPIIATSFVSRGVLFSRYYLLLLAHRALCLPVNYWTFWHFERDNASPETLPNPLGLRRTASASNQPKHSQLREFKKAFKNKTTLISASFIFAYQGAEVSISGWVLNYLIHYRGGVPAKVGYVTAGFWAGITLGRFTLPFLAQRIGDKLLVWGLVLGAMAFQVLVWQVPNVIGGSVAVALVGYLLGPIYACATTATLRMLPRSSQNTALAFITSAGSSGGAVAPFMTGLLAQVVGTWVLHPVCIVLYTCMLGSWYGLFRGNVKRRE